MIVSVDSMQVYRGMDIGTAKPSVEMRAQIPHRMIDIVDPTDEFSAAEFQEVGRRAIDAAEDSHGRVVIVGGSGLHFRALVDPLTFAPTDPAIRADLEARTDEDARAELLAADPHADDHVDVANPRRVVRALEIIALTGETPTQRHTSAEADAVRSYVPVRPFLGFGLDAGAAQAARAGERFVDMLDAGLLDEVTRLAPIMGRTASQAVGYKELLPVVRDGADLDDASGAAIAATMGLVKRQRTFFRRDPRVRWLPWEDDDELRVGRAVDVIKEAAEWTS